MDSNTTYTLLAPITSNLTTFDAGVGCPFGTYLGTVINIFLGLLAVLAMLMIVIGGIEYMTSELISSKEAGKERMRSAVLGLLIALSSWLILNTINPAILNICLDLTKYQ